MFNLGHAAFAFWLCIAYGIAAARRKQWPVYFIPTSRAPVRQNERIPSSEPTGRLGCICATKLALLRLERIRLADQPMPCPGVFVISNCLFFCLRRIDMLAGRLWRVRLRSDTRTQFATTDSVCSALFAKEISIPPSSGD